MISPPATVRRADWSRTMKRSPCTSTVGCSRSTCTSPSPPGSMARPSRSATRPVREAAPTCTCTGVQWALLARQHPEAGIETAGGGPGRLGQQPVAAPHAGPGELPSRDIDGRPVPDRRGVRPLALGVNPPHPHLDAGGRQHEPLARPDRAREDGSRDDEPRPVDGELAVDGEPESTPPPPGPAPGARAGSRMQVPAQGLDPDAPGGSDGKDGHSLEPGSGEEGPDLLLDADPTLGVDEIDLGEGDRAPLDAEQIQDGEMLPGLGHGAVVTGHDEQREVDRRHSGQHVADELLVPRHVHEPEHRSLRQALVGEAEIDAQPPRLLLGQTVGVDARQRLHELRLAVIDVSGGGDQHGCTRGAGSGEARSRPDPG